MGMIPVLWTSTKDGGKFDTNGLLFLHTLRMNFFFDATMAFFFWTDWMVAGGSISGNQSVAAFEQILTNASEIDTG